MGRKFEWLKLFLDVIDDDKMLEWMGKEPMKNFGIFVAFMITCAQHRRADDEEFIEVSLKKLGRNTRLRELNMRKSCVRLGFLFGFKVELTQEKALITWPKFMELQKKPLRYGDGKFARTGEEKSRVEKSRYKEKPLQVSCPEQKNLHPSPQRKKKVYKISFNAEHTKFEGIDSKDLDRWKEVYPNVDVLAEIKKMESWFEANPRRRKKNIKPFIVTWLTRAQDKPTPIVPQHQESFRKRMGLNDEYSEDW